MTDRLRTARDESQPWRGPAPVPAHIPALDGLRGVAAVIVMLSHVASATGVAHDYFQRGGGQIGVMIFFALSGFLMAHIYFETPPRASALYKYLVARVARVVPLFLAVVFLSYAIAKWKSGEYPFVYPLDGADLIDHLLLRRGESVLWTIPVELRFYALFPFFWIIYRFSSNLALLSCLALALAYYLLPPFSMPVMHLGHYFVIGMATKLLSQRIHLAPRFNDAGFVASAVMIAFLFPMPFIWLFGHTPRMWWEPQIALAVFLLLFFTLRSNLAANLLGTLWLRKLGDISYSLYLTHMLTIGNLRYVLDPQTHPVLFGISAITLAILQSFVIFILFERPARRLIRRLAAPRRRPAMRSAPSAPREG
ncbi:acyltransferase family protein [Afifella marina]|uniref:Peptidoglycan/LPS O-acetylase OafA/YrhL, contains acyltransferase and SGNH-hydrolase domains n=1 Tax=Afifella marina DSM 2698 TaxID=1120955 RepID=A0A1G5NB48_AFIMA|nr:acyltransferase [Afifella marina]MBK1623202.1 acyltransferase [Afifella marina DSM 2698]MBK1626196.1 acyltransferase [Afifella marina]MBK5917074.1 hypothetical protein [Afifella marina]RAI22065.1 hypothetical protein CH311_04970 [Afifella marina DSM 2698]SCZ34645.1 Peptidoglycan/LPS O-acetylase OafA/YrhL, contains acyltransferase and SGNH-hydrolase domains [Afifella marina DSM 2698]